jgi:hypothetical protein
MAVIDMWSLDKYLSADITAVALLANLGVILCLCHFVWTQAMARRDLLSVLAMILSIPSKFAITMT